MSPRMGGSAMYLPSMFRYTYLGILYVLGNERGWCRYA